MMLKLDSVTLISADGKDPELATKALIQSAQNIHFAQVRILTFRRPRNLPSWIDYVKIPRMTFNDYQRLSVKRLYDFVDTQFCLSVQPDGFVINPHVWSNTFLKYDYIGAPWPRGFVWSKGIRVGNSGFCLRSKRFLRISKENVQLHENSQGKLYNDDITLCCLNRRMFTRQGMKFAPVRLALRFSQELPVEEWIRTPVQSFGFHGYFREAFRAHIRNLRGTS